MRHQHVRGARLWKMEARAGSQGRCNMGSHLAGNFVRRRIFSYQIDTLGSPNRVQGQKVGDSYMENNGNSHAGPPPDRHDRNQTMIARRHERAS